MKRKAIIIVNDGGETNPIPNIHIDERNFIDYFSSNRGGAWEKDEIVSKNFSSAAELSSFLKVNCNDCDYLLIVFLGHGYYDSRYGRMIELAEGIDVKVSDIRNWVSFTRCLLITDTCATVICHEELTKSFNAQAICESAQEARIRTCYRDVYNKAIMNTPADMFTAGYAASKNESASDDEDGGYYSSSLLDVCKNMKKGSVMLKTAAFTYVHNQALELVKIKSGNKQHPEVSTQRFPNQLPFIVY